MQLLFSLICFIIAVFAFFATFIAVQIWLAATILLRLRGQLRQGGALVLRLGLFGQHRRQLALAGRRAN
jgi:hypothetical protein